MPTPDDPCCVATKLVWPDSTTPPAARGVSRVDAEDDDESAKAPLRDVALGCKADGDDTGNNAVGEDAEAVSAGEENEELSVRFVPDATAAADESDFIDAEEGNAPLPLSKPPSFLFGVRAERLLTRLTCLAPKGDPCPRPPIISHFSRF